MMYFLIFFSIVCHSETLYYNVRYALEGEFPFLASVHNADGRFRGSGAIISYEHVLTSGYTAYNWKSIDKCDFLIVPGSGKRTKYNLIYNKDMIKTKKCFYHPNFRNTFQYDIALLYLNSSIEEEGIIPLNYISREQGVFAIELNKIIKSGTMCESMGWGGKNQLLTAASLRASALEMCRYHVCGTLELNCAETMDEVNQICALPAEGKTCFGDYGSPLVCDGYLWGVLSSHDTKCGSSSIFTSPLELLSYVDFTSNLTTESYYKHYYNLSNSYKLLNGVISYSGTGYLSLITTVNVLFYHGLINYYC